MVRPQEMITPVAICKKYGYQIKENIRGTNAYDDGTHGVKIYMDNSKLYEFDQNNLVRTPAKFTASS
jgi:hypothetical protein